MSGRVAWARWVGESAEEYAAFMAYLEQPAPRSLTRVTVAGYAWPTSKASQASRTFAWGARVAAHDEHMTAIRDQERESIARLGARDRQLEHERLLAMASQLIGRELHKLLAVAMQSEAPGIVRAETLLSKLPEIIKASRLVGGEATEHTSTDNPFEGATLDQLQRIRAILSEGQDT